jgi:hypothetical protein
LMLDIDQTAKPLIFIHSRFVHTQRTSRIL